jgi:tRNA 2-thiocytidine biosynthesis protein TtcA
MTVSDEMQSGRTPSFEAGSLDAPEELEPFEGASPEPPGFDLERKLARLVARAVTERALVENGDRILVAVSGGKDSYVLLRLLQRMQRVAPLEFELLAFHLDQAHPGFPVERVEAQIAATGVPYVIHRQDTYAIVKAKLKPGATTCSLCSRLRRGILYTQADALGCNKIALGHHRDDLVHTFLLNIFFTGQIKSMAARLEADNGRHVVIRPLLYCAEELIARYAQALGFEAAPCTLCTDQDGLKREMVRRLVEDLDARHPGLKESLFASLQNVRPTHLLDTQLRTKGDAP